MGRKLDRVLLGGLVGVGADHRLLFGADFIRPDGSRVHVGELHFSVFICHRVDVDLWRHGDPSRNDRC